MRREDIQPAYTPMPEIACPKCLRSGRYGKLHDDLGVLYQCGWNDCTHAHFLAWSSLEDLKDSAQGGTQ